MSEERKCPECGQAEHYYPTAWPTGNLTAEGKIELEVTEGGHCLNCGHEVPVSQEETARRWWLAKMRKALRA